jgi:peptidoglycan-associated lipoprotein
MRTSMTKKILVLLSAILLFSCQNDLAQKNSSETTTTPEQTATTEPQEKYQTIENEEQAAALNKEAEAQAQEIEVQDRIFFGYDSNSLSAEAKKVLDVQVLWLKNDTAVNVTLEGHCDDRGTREYNIALGERRANMVKNYLVSQGIEASRLTTISYGKERPAFFGNDEKVYMKNRRAVTILAN